MPIHTLYIGAHAFDAETPRRFTAEAAEFFRVVFPGAVQVASGLGYDGGNDLAAVDPEVLEEARRRVARRFDGGEVGAVIEDLRIDFEDGYDGRGNAQEDRDAERCAEALVAAHGVGALPRGFGLRVRSMADSTRRRSLATLDRFMPRLIEGLGGLPEDFVVTLAKIDHPDEVKRLADALDEREVSWGLDAGSVAVELMAETPRSIFDESGQAAAPALLAAARGRCVGVHFGVYDYTASLGLVAGLQGPRHPACDLARGLLQISLAGRDVELSDGSSRHMPRLGSPPGVLEASVREVALDIRHALERGLYRGWDMAPSHIAIRWLVTTVFFLRYLPEMNERLVAAKDLSSGDPEQGELEDAATVTALRTYFHHGLGCGALMTEDLPVGFSLP